MKRLAVTSVVLVLLVVVMAGACKRTEQPAPAAGTTAGNATTRTAAPDTPPAAAPVGSEVGSTMPEYSAMWLDGSKFDLQSKRGKVVLLNLWATWCGPCRYEIPELQVIHNKYAARGFEVIGVSVDETGAQSVRDFVKEHEMTYPVVLDEEQKLPTVFQTSVLPTSVIIDRNGKIVWKKLGAIMPNDQELITALEAAL